MALVGTEIINASAAAIETNSPVFILASLDAVLLDNHRLHLSREWWNDCEMDHAGVLGARSLGSIATSICAFGPQRPFYVETF